MSVVSEIMRFQIERQLDKQEYDWEVEATNVIEELLEAYGVNSRETAMVCVGDIMLRAQDTFRYAKPTILRTEEVDAYADIIVFAIGAITKLGYDAEEVLYEVGREINSRTGKIINGKFTKDKSPEAMEKWYKANFKDCKLSDLKATPKQRQVFMNSEGYMATDKEILRWFKNIARDENES